MDRIGVAGLGKMGAALAARLVRSGFSVSGWTRSGLAEARAGALGIAGCASLAELSERSDIVVLALFDGTAVHAVLDGLVRQRLSGQLIADTSTVSPEVLRSRIDEIRAAGGSAVDAPIAGGPAMVTAGTAGTYVGGAAIDFERFRPVASVFAKRVLHVGPLGAGATAKIVNNMMLTGFWEVLREAVLVGKRGGLDFETMMRLLTESPAASPAFLERLPILRGESDSVGFTVDGVVKDLVMFVETAKALGVATPALEAARDAFRTRAAAGHGAADLGALVREAYREG